MSFGEILAQEFNNLTGGCFSEEKILFAKLEDAFFNLRSTCKMHKIDYAIDIIHGSKSFIDFEYNGVNISSITPPQSTTKELADMMFIVFSARKRELRISYMQNKKGSNYRHFYADLLQLYFLKSRPEILSATLPACTFGDSKILSDALLPSVGSYGVFYVDTMHDKIEMSYFPASNLEPVNQRGGEKRVVHFIDSLRTKEINGYIESQGEATLSAFGNALINMSIGTPIFPRSELFRKVYCYLFQNSPAFSIADFPVPDGFVPNQDMNFIRFQDSSPTIVVINSDVFENLEL